MRPADTQAIKSNSADKTPRTKTELPAQLSDGTVLADQTD